MIDSCVLLLSEPGRQVGGTSISLLRVQDGGAHIQNILESGDTAAIFDEVNGFPSVTLMPLFILSG